MTSKSAIASFTPGAPRTPRHIRDVTRPFRIYFRRKRMRDLFRWMAVSDGTTIIDVGGTPFVWRLTNLDPSVTIVNLKAAWPIEGNWVVLASGLALPFRDHAFDVCFSNSVIEHVGDAQARADFAGRFAGSPSAIGCRRPIGTSRWKRISAACSCIGCPFAGSTVSDFSIPQGISGNPRLKPSAACMAKSPDDDAGPSKKRNSKLQRRRKHSRSA